MNLPFAAERPVPGVMPDIIFDGVMARYILAKKLINEIHGHRILDVGCGTGIGSGYLASSGFSVTGIDVDFESINWGNNNKLHQNLILQEGRGEQLLFGDETFDVIVAFECIEHMDSPYAFILEAQRVLKKGGILICSVPYCLGDIMAELLHGGSNPYHIQRFTPQTMRHLLSKNFVIQEEWGQTFHSVDYYTYVFVRHFIRQRVKDIPTAGKVFLNYRNKRNSRLIREKLKSDIKQQMNYGLWKEECIPSEWKPKRINAELKLVPETLIYMSQRL